MNDFKTTSLKHVKINLKSLILLRQQLFAGFNNWQKPFFFIKVRIDKIFKIY